MAGQMPTSGEYTNSLGMRFARIEAGAFQMGHDGSPLPDGITDQPYLAHGDHDERPVHAVTISNPFYMGVRQVTNAEFEQFDPSHRTERGKMEFSKDDDEAVLFVDWHDAVGFCEWLSDKENLPYRLPTEAEWEYACRAGTISTFWTGDHLPEEFHKNQRECWYPEPGRANADADIVQVHVGKTPPNPWGLMDMHGNVEEWCSDWYGPYESGDQTDPVGCETGRFKIARGGSHSTELPYLRSANRAGTVPEDKNWVIGIRVVIGDAPSAEPTPAPPLELNARDVLQYIPSELMWSPDMEKPYFNEPKEYVKIPDGPMGPMFSQHNHDPAIAPCPNGDLLAIWYSCVRERGRELNLLASRLRLGQDEWDGASVFWDVPDRNNHAPALFFDGETTMYQFVGLSVAATWGNLATVLRTSTDSGATWSDARMIVPEHGIRHMPIPSVFRTRDGTIVLPCDAVTGGEGGTALWLSDDDGESWRDAGGNIAGIHAGVTQLRDGRLLAYGRGDDIDGMMPKSVSGDMGKTWEWSASQFQPVGGGQRPVLLRLQEGPLFFASFADNMLITDASGTERAVSGLFGAISRDEGRSWTSMRLISDDGDPRELPAMDGHLFTLSRSSAEPRGYMATCQAQDGVIHLISSQQHYAFNLKWLETPAPPLA